MPKSSVSKKKGIKRFFSLQNNSSNKYSVALKKEEIKKIPLPRFFHWKSAIGNFKIQHWFWFRIQASLLKNDLIWLCLDLVYEQWNSGQGDCSGSPFSYVLTSVASTAWIPKYTEKFWPAVRIDQMDLLPGDLLNALQFHWRLSKTIYHLHT